MKFSVLPLGLVRSLNSLSYSIGLHFVTFTVADWIAGPEAFLQGWPEVFLQV